MFTFLAIIFWLGLISFFWPVFVVLGSILLLPEFWIGVVIVLILGNLLIYLDSKKK